jgi:hypothetical protein
VPKIRLPHTAAVHYHSHLVFHATREPTSMNHAIHSLQDNRPARAGGTSCMRFAPIAIGMGLRQTAGHLS